MKSARHCVLYSAVALISLGVVFVETSVENTVGCTLNLPYKGGGWPNSLVFNESQQICIREGTFSQVSLSISKLPGTLGPLNVTVRPILQSKLVELVGGQGNGHILSFEGVDNVEVSDVRFRQPFFQSGSACLGVYNATSAILDSVEFEDCVNGSFKCAECKDVRIEGTDMACSNSSKPLLILYATEDNGQAVSIKNSTFHQGASSGAGCVAFKFDCSSCGNNVSLFIEDATFEGCHLDVGLDESAEREASNTIQAPASASAIAMTFQSSTEYLHDTGNYLSFYLRGVVVDASSAADRKSPAVGIVWMARDYMRNCGNNVHALLFDTDISCSGESFSGSAMGLLWTSAKKIISSGNSVTLELQGHTYLRDCRSESPGAGVSISFRSRHVIKNSGNNLLLSMQHQSTIANCSAIGGELGIGGGVSISWVAREGGTVDSGNGVSLLMRDAATIRDSSAGSAGGGVAMAWFVFRMIESANDAFVSLFDEASIFGCAVVHEQDTAVGAGVALLLYSSYEVKLSANRWGVHLLDESSIHDMTLQNGRGACLGFLNAYADLMDDSFNSLAIMLRDDAKIYDCVGEAVDGAGIAIALDGNEIMNNCFSYITIALSGRASIFNASSSLGNGGAVSVSGRAPNLVRRSSNNIALFLIEDSSIVNCYSKQGGAVRFMLSASLGAGSQDDSGNHLHVTVANNAFVRDCGAKDFGGAFSVGWNGRSMSNSGREFELVLATNARLENCHSGNRGGAIALQWVSSAVENSGDASTIVTLQNVRIENCQAKIAGGVVYASWSGPFMTQNITLSAAGTTHFKHNYALQGGVIAAEMQKGHQSKGKVIILLFSSIVISDTSAHLGSFAFVRSLNIEMKIGAHVLLKNLTSLEGGTVIFWNVNSELSASVIVEGATITDQNGAPFVFLANDLGTNTDAFLEVTDSTLTKIINGGQGILTARYLSHMKTEFHNSIITDVRISGSQGKAQSGSNSHGAILSAYTCMSSYFFLGDTVLKNINATNMAGVYILDTMLLSSVFIINSYFYDVVIDSVMEASWITGSTSTNIYFVHSTLELKMVNQYEEGAVLHLIKTDAINSVKASCFIFNTSFVVDLIGHFTTVSFVESLPTYRYLRAIDSSYSGLTFDKDSVDLMFIPSTWLQTTDYLPANVSWPQLFGSIASITYADDDGQTDGEGIGLLLGPYCYKAKRHEEVAICQQQDIRDSLEQLSSYDHTLWSCPRGYRLVRDVTTERERISSYHSDCTPGGSGPNSCDLIVYPTKLSCVACEEKHFSAQRGEARGEAFKNIACLLCTAGSYCPGKGDLNLQRGYWGSIDMSLLNSNASILTTEHLVVRCPPDYCCLPPANATTCSLYKNGEVEDVTESGRCQGFRDGTLCGSCRQGYTFRLFGDYCILYRHGDMRLPIALGILALFGLLFVLYHTHLRSLSENEDKGDSSRRSKKKDPRKASLAHITFFFSMADLFYDPMISGSSSVAQELATLAASITNGFQMKVAKHHHAYALASNSSFFQLLDAPLWQDATGTDKMLMRLFPAASMLAWLFLILPISAMCRKESKKRKASLHQLKIELSERSFRDIPSSKTSSEIVDDPPTALTKAKRSRTRSRGDVVIHAMGISFGRGAKALYNIMVFSYGSLLVVALRLMSCTAVLNGQTGVLEQRRTFSGDQLCWTEAHVTEALGILTLLVLVLFPVSCIVLHKRYKHNPNSTQLPRRGKWIRQFRELTEYLEAPYRPSCWWYDVFFLVKRVLLVVSYMQLRHFDFLREGILIFLLLSFISIDCVLRPFASLRDLIVGVVLQGFLILLVFLPAGDAFLFSLDISFVLDESRLSVFALLSNVQVGVLLVAVLYLLYELFRSLYVPARRMGRTLRIRYQQLSAKRANRHKKKTDRLGRTLSDLADAV